MLRKGDLTQGGITTTLLQFTLPMLAGSLLQQCYNIADTLIVGQCIGSNALAAVGSAYTLMVFLISILLGLSMGSGTVFSLQYGAGDLPALRRSIYVSFLLIGTVTVLLNVAVFLWLDPILRWLQVPYDVYPLMRNYLWIIFWGIAFTFLYNFYAALLRAVGDSVTPLWFLAVSVVLNIGLDLFLILVLDQGIEGAAVATVIAQGMAASGILLYTYKTRPELRLHRKDMRFDRSSLKEITSFSTLTCVQQSVMNFGILMVQGLVNSFGTAVMAAFAAAVKIDSFAYMPVQEFGNAFSTFVAQNFGARKGDRIRRGVRSAFLITIVFSLVISLLVFFFAKPLMLIFVRPDEAEILRIGTEYLRIEGTFYLGIGILFLLYGYYRAIRMPGMSVVLTILSLGTRVVLSYWLASIPSIGVTGIWWSIPIGWFLADLVGIAYYRYRRYAISRT
ncbi:MAG TPA: MATE family efflux transporter [Parabacteroides johnsonii]|uniref:MATE family efflux transporter n=1 Tax=Parabacteroides johnsonii TaxID=387661 RepID=UPI00101D90F0|nr:MATE family efflux transporter [Parabacteroides johnsonii]UEA91753.1 MATE family efflux transporter [Parabacteroides johnsonii]UWP43907.1 MATE family efflux transporter [Parabacteroides johnsonii DSM 18315]HJG99244.1 MATE family efflux transporter [Parabacteroides johnsonii]